MLYRLQIAFLFSLIFFTQTYLGAVQQKIESDDNPLTIIKTSTTKMIEQLTLRKSEITGDPTIVMDIVEGLLIPHFASNSISRKVLGKHAKKVTKEQKVQFAKEFRFYMVRFYAKIFATYSDQTFNYLAAPKYKGKKRVTVKTELIQAGIKPIAIHYKMQRSGKTWKIIDLKIEGISMVISNRHQFVNQISADGIDTVIAKLKYKNNKAKNNG